MSFQDVEGYPAPTFTNRPTGQTSRRSRREYRSASPSPRQYEQNLRKGPAVDATVVPSYYRSKSPMRPTYNQKKMNTRTEPPEFELLSQQIDGALHQHKKDRGWRKEQSLTEQSTTVGRGRAKNSFAKLSEDIIQFQKMVRELETVTAASFIQTPESQWKTRILVSSAQDASRDIPKKLLSASSTQTATNKAAFSKLQRDFGRIDEKFRVLLGAYHQKQRAEIAMLSAEPDSFQSKQQKQVGRQHQEEDFFDRKMREREQEINQINQKMHRVNQIYSELGKLVNDQQEKIDVVSDHIGYSRAGAQCGLERLQNNRKPMFGLGKAEPLPPPPRNDLGDFHWTAPFVTFKEDFVSLQKEVALKAREVAARTRCGSAASSMFQCADDTYQAEYSSTSPDFRRQHV